MSSGFSHISGSNSQHGGKSADFEKKLMLKKIADMHNMPTPSGHVMKVMLLLRDEDVRMNDLIRAIEKDQTLVAQILKLINSGFYGLRQTIDSVERAVNLLGILQIKQLVYSASIMDLFSDDEKVQWDHSYSCSVLMGNLLKENEIPAASNLPLTMLMHDIGKVVLKRFSPKKYKMAMEHSRNDHLPQFRAEDTYLHINHADAACLLMQKWDMTEDIIKPVSYHHYVSPPEDYILETALTQFVNWVDCRCRNIICDEPSKELLNAAGIEAIDKDYWVNYQTELIKSIEGEDAQVIDTQKHSHGTSVISRSGVPAPAATPPAQRPSAPEEPQYRPVASPPPEKPASEPVKPVEVKKEMSTEVFARPGAVKSSESSESTGNKEDTSTEVFKRPQRTKPQPSEPEHQPQPEVDEDQKTPTEKFARPEVPQAPVKELDEDEKTPTEKFERPEMPEPEVSDSSTTIIKRPYKHNDKDGGNSLIPTPFDS